MRWVEGHIGHSRGVLQRCHCKQSSCSCEFGCRSFLTHKPCAVCFLSVMGKKLARFYEPQSGRILLNISLSDSVFETTKTSGKRFNFDLPNSFNLWTVADRDLWWFVNFDVLKFLTALVLFNHSNKNSDWLILACLMRVHNVREMRVPWLIRTSPFYFHTVIGTSARISQYIL